MGLIWRGRRPQDPADGVDLRPVRGGLMPRPIFPPVRPRGIFQGLAPQPFDGLLQGTVVLDADPAGQGFFPA